MARRADERVSSSRVMVSFWILAKFLWECRPRSCLSSSLCTPPKARTAGANMAIKGLPRRQAPKGFTQGIGLLISEFVSPMKLSMPRSPSSSSPRFATTRLRYLSMSFGSGSFPFASVCQPRQQLYKNALFRRLQGSEHTFWCVYDQALPHI